MTLSSKVSWYIQQQSGRLRNSFKYFMAQHTYSQFMIFANTLL